MSESVSYRVRIHPAAGRLAAALGAGIKAAQDAAAGQGRLKAAGVETSAGRLETMAPGRLQATLVDTLQSLGYAVKLQVGRMRAVCQQSCLWAQLDPEGGLHLDLSGFSGLSCLREVQRIEAALGARGLELERTIDRSGPAVLLRGERPEFSNAVDPVRTKAPGKSSDHQLL